MRVSPLQRGTNPCQLGSCERGQFNSSTGDSATPIFRVKHLRGPQGPRMNCIAAEGRQARPGGREPGNIWFVVSDSTRSQFTQSPRETHTLPLNLYQVFKAVKLCPSETSFFLTRRKSLKSSDPWHPPSLSPNSWNRQAGFRAWSSHLISLSLTCSDSQSRRVSSSQQPPLHSLSSHHRAAHVPE